MGGRSPRLIAGALPALAAAIVAIGLVAWPMLFTTSGLGGDWEHHLWFVWQQMLAIAADHSPSMFINTDYSAFYPQFAFYGATIYTFTGTLAFALGESPIAAYVITYLLGFAGAYGGWYWIGRIAGLDRWLAQAPALLFVTAGAYLTLVYGQGDWPEFLAMSMLPLMIASGLSVIRAERLRFLPALALASSCVVFFGSHLLTVLWGSTLLALTVVVVVVCVPAVRPWIRARRVIRLAALSIPALLVNAWFLLPTVVYSRHTSTGSKFGAAARTLHATMRLVAFHHMFTFSRPSTARHYPDYVLSLPTVTILWVLASVAVLLWSVRRGTWLRLLVIFAVITAAIVVVMTHVGLILALPKPYTLLEFSYRMEGYVLIGVSAAVLAALVLLRSAANRLRWWVWTIVPVLLVSVVGAIQQLNAYPHTLYPRQAVLTSAGEVFAHGYDDYAYVPLPFISARGLPELEITPEQIRDDRVAVTVHYRPGQLVATNIAGGPDVLRISGARIAGTDEATQLVLAIGSPTAVASAHPHTPVSTERVSLSPAQNTPIVLGRALTFVGVAVLIALLAALLARDYRRWRGRDGRAAVGRC